MILVRRATSVSELEALLNKIRPDVSQPLVIVDRQADGAREPEYTVIWEQFRIDPDRLAVTRARKIANVPAESET